MRRREVLKIAAFGGALAMHRQAISMDNAIPIIDAHIHLFDPTRPGGVPWPEKDDRALYKPALPARYEALSRRFGVVGAIAIEASPLPMDNQWLLEIASANEVIVGVIGNLDPLAKDFSQQFDALHENPLFLGIRYGNLWNRDLLVDLEKRGFLDGLKVIARAGLVFESANPDARLIQALLSVAERVPDLRVVVDHLPHAAVPTASVERDEYWSNIRRLGQNRNLFVKLSEIPVVKNGKLVTDPNFYREPLDVLFDVFGEGRLIFGSDWPNSDHVASYAETFDIVRNCMARKSPQMQENYYWKNSIGAYRWRPRRTNQPSE